MGWPDRAKKGHIQTWLPSPALLRGDEDSYPSQGTAVERNVIKLNYRSISAWDQPKLALPSVVLPPSLRLWRLILHSPSHHLSIPAVQEGRAAAFGSSVGVGLVKLQLCPQLTQNRKKTWKNHENGLFFS